MTATLRPTGARLALLRAAAAGNVHGSYDGTMKFTVYIKANGRDYDETVPSNRFHDLRAAGWLRIGRPLGESYYSRRPVEVTAAGRLVLDAHPEEQP